MCFSPSASFSASAALTLTGALALRRVSARRELLFASIPIFFAGQQFIEGLLWLVLLRQSTISPYWLTQGYVIFVGLLWPILPSLSLWMIEPESLRRRKMLVVLATGFWVAFYTLDGVLRFPISASVANYCIDYDYPIHQSHLMLVPYVIATCGAFFLSSFAMIRWLGIINVTAFIITYYFYRYDLASVWCFFAAAISGLIYLHFERRYQPISVQISPTL